MIEDLIKIIEKYMTEEEVAFVMKAYEYAKLMHKDQKRKSGEPYIIHPVNVAIILADLDMDVETIVSALLHDVVEDTPATYDDIKEMFSEDVAKIVDGVTKLNKLNYKSSEAFQAENLRKMILAMNNDIRVIIVKLADRLHNLRTLEYMNEEKRKQKAQETIEIYAPLAGRLGIFKIKWELEDLSLRYLDPEGYYDLVEKINKKRSEREKEINEIIKKISAELDKQELHYDISGRPKNFYSIYKKMKGKSKSFESIYDLIAVRILVDTVKDCYAVLGIVHSMWKPLPGRFKDYIAMPKPNMYQSLHTTVISDTGEIFEIQIRTYEMHEVAEYGIAAHWKYKGGKTQGKDVDSKLDWLRQLLEWQKDLKDPKEFIDTLKIDFFDDEVFVFTPNGDVVDLPEGSTPVDFAYRVHTGVGNTCVGAKVDSRIVPLNYKLKNGNIVEVITQKSSSGPSRDWLKFVKSPRARQKIKQWFKSKEKDISIEKGKELFDREAKKLGLETNILDNEKIYQKLAKELSINSISDLFASIGYGNFKEKLVINKILNIKNAIENVGLTKNEDDYLKSSSSKKDATGVRIDGLEGMKIKFAKCCNPVPGDEIIGFVTRGYGVSVHRKDCTNIANYLDSDRCLDAEWDTEASDKFLANVTIRAVDRTGILSEITAMAKEANVGIQSLSAKSNTISDIFIYLTFEVVGKDELDKMIQKLKTINGILDVYRA
ncbi:bifunctional (p)ppGpp synthetase/guanosine-3',5'-bis(diphosphate) 3'-pyrophosphohydrolase [Peptostreptococcaceae bacterium oral taxon 929]|uniref:RelA/SpoT family protein n=1 Tax=Fenollaria massiliensis TaxID=938288 RepID=UPI000369CE2B|nr:bifunctional (p)ppGpp synthetase/guanosine-3',5'-bis(diphosphate) 3'-pyrophosphohydrolase [Fenollaria massiliensis]AVM66726.1 bifunctional (p)ppGpp synthetase/guanosine-3',5'-bis(diphosphate) 3'-pyrophosphohydrolase [Peptostreptococcaceae bacterium oral taxon 929]